MSFFKSRLFFGQVALLVAVLTMIFSNNDAGVGVAIFTMGIGLYWILTSESRYFDRLRSS